jgi:hypothetical protein
MRAARLPRVEAAGYSAVIATDRHSSDGEIVAKAATVPLSLVIPDSFRDPPFREINGLGVCDAVDAGTSPA